MKKVLMMMALVFMALSTNAQSAVSKQLQKQMQKEYKQKVKEFKKDNWQIFGSSRTLEVALLTHYEKLAKAGDSAFEVTGTASKCKSKNIGHQTAINNACNIYARQAESSIKGRIVSDMGANSDSIAAEFDHFYAAYESMVEKEIKGEMQESFSMIRNLGDGSYEMQSFFIVNNEAATKARIRAFELAAKESAAAKMNAEQISKFIKEGFNN